MLSVHGLFRVLFRGMWIWNWNEYWTPFCCCFAQLMDADTGNVTVEPWRSRPSGLQNSYRSIRGELKLQASLDHKQMFPSPPRILLQRRLEVWVRNLSCCYRSSLWCWWKPQVASSKSSEIWFSCTSTFETDSPVQNRAVQSRQPAGTLSEPLQDHHWKGCDRAAWSSGWMTWTFARQDLITI